MKLFRTDIMLTANSFEDLHNFFNQFKQGKYSWLYRGQSDASWELKPKIGRDEYNVGGIGLGRFRAWKMEAVAHIDLPNNEWEQLAIAQHYGLATLLLDWSENPLVAAFFAVYENPQKDGIIYVHFPGNILREDKLRPEVFESEKKNNLLRHMYAGDILKDIPPSIAYHPKSIDRRIINQKGVFTIHPVPQNELKSFEVHDPHLEENLFSIKINAEAKKEILKMLQKYGINYHFLFPDLGGLSEFINYETMGIVKERVERKN